MWKLQRLRLRGSQMLYATKDIKPHSEKYVYFDFETKLDPKTNKHIVNYCIVQDFDGKENVFHKVGEFCEWVFNKSRHKGYAFLAHCGKGYDFQSIAECRMVSKII